MKAMTNPKLAILPKLSPGDKKVLTSQALDFLTILEQEFREERLHLLNLRQEKQKLFDRGIFPDFLKETKQVRDSAWKAAKIPEDLFDRRVEITGPVDRKMIIN